MSRRGKEEKVIYSQISDGCWGDFELSLHRNIDGLRELDVGAVYFDGFIKTKTHTRTIWRGKSKTEGMKKAIEYMRKNPNG
jgi:hypothetical protein